MAAWECKLTAVVGLKRKGREGPCKILDVKRSSTFPVEVLLVEAGRVPLGVPGGWLPLPPTPGGTGVSLGVPPSSLRKVSVKMGSQVKLNRRGVAGMDKEQLQAAIQQVHDENLRAILQALFEQIYGPPE